MQKQLSIITVNYNGLKDTCELIDTLPIDEYSLEVIVVDNGSKVDEAAEIKKRYPQVIAVRSKQNLGFAGGNNLGIKEANGKYLYFINNDTLLYRRENREIAKNSLQVLIDRLESSEKIGVVCPKIYFSWEEKLIQFAGYTPLSRITIRNRALGCGEKDKGQYDTPHPTPYAHGAAMMVKRETIEKAGTMPECYFLYYEELDWSMMMRRAGYDIWYEPAATIYHKESQSTGQNSPLRTFYITRNRLLYVKRNVDNIEKYISYIYLICIVAVKDMFKYMLKGRSDLARAVFKGVCSFLNY